MSSFMIGLQITGGVIVALLMAYVGWKAWGFIALFVRAVIRVFERRAMVQQRIEVKELRARRQHEWETQAKLYAKKLLDAVPELEEHRQVVLSTPYVRSGSNAKRTRVLSKIRRLVKSHWIVTGADACYRDEVLKQLRTNWGHTHESC